MRKSLLITAVVASALVLTGCSNGAGTAAPATHHTATKLHAAHTPVATPSPSAVAHPKFQGTIDYATFGTAWASTPGPNQQVDCAAFFQANPPATTVVPSDSSTGPEVVQWFNAYMAPIYEINNDTSDPRNNQVADNLLSCMVSAKGSGPTALASLKSLLDSQFQNGWSSAPSSQSQIDPNQVTKYSDGFFGEPDGAGAFYNSMSVAGHNTDEPVGGTGVDDLTFEQFDWQSNGSFTGFKLSDTGSGVNFGPKPPVVIGQ